MTCVTGCDTSSVSSQGSGPLRGPNYDLPQEQPHSGFSSQSRRSQTGDLRSYNMNSAGNAQNHRTPEKNSVGRSHRQSHSDGTGENSPDPQISPDSTDEVIPRKTHGHRKTYPEEQVMWIWFFRIDLQIPWCEIEKKFLARWPHDERALGGMQCRFYRSVGQYGLPKMRIAKEAVKETGEKICYRWGMWPMMRRSYPWMDEHKHTLQGRSMLNATRSSHRLTSAQAMWEAARTMDQNNCHRLQYSRQSRCQRWEPWSTYGVDF